MNNNKCIYIVLSLVLLAGTVSALPIHFKPLVGGILQKNSTFVYQLNFTNNVDCSDVIFSNTSTIVTDRYGIGFIDLDISSMTRVPNYLCEYRDGVLRKIHNMSDETFDKLFVESILSNNWSNVTLTESQISDLQSYLLETDQRYNETNQIISINNSLQSLNSTVLANYSNDTEHFQGYTPDSLMLWIISTFNLINNSGETDPVYSANSYAVDMNQNVGTDDSPTFDGLSLGADGQSGHSTLTLWAENGYEGRLKFMEASNYGFDFEYDASANYLYLNRYYASTTPEPLIGLNRDTGEIYHYTDTTATKGLTSHNPQLTNFHVEDSYVGLVGEGIGETGMIGLYNGNDLTNGFYKDGITIDILGPGTYYEPYEKYLTDAAADFFSIGSVNESTQQVNITVDLGSYLPVHSSATWQPFLQYRTGICSPPISSNCATYFSSVKVYISPDGTNWATSSPESNWETTDFYGDSQVNTYWFGTVDSPSSYATQVRYIKFVLEDIQISPTYAYNTSVWISEIGMRQRASPYAQQYASVSGDEFYGDVTFYNGTNTTITFDASNGEITAYNYVDLTEGTEKTNKESLSAVKNMKTEYDEYNNKYVIDHSTIDDEAKKNITKKIKTNCKLECKTVKGECIEYIDEDGKKQKLCEEDSEICIEVDCIEEEIFVAEGRNLNIVWDWFRGAITYNNDEIELLKKENDALKDKVSLMETELCSKDKSYSWC